jgi:ribonuclease-3
LPLPRYTETDRKGPPHEPVFTIRVEVVGEKAQSGQGRSKRMAEQDAAALLLAAVKGRPQ